GIDAGHRAVEIDAIGAAAVFDALIMARALHENPAHGLGRRGEEMAAAIPAPFLLLSRHAQVGFVHERRRLERLVPLALARQTGSRQLAEFVIHFGQQLARCPGAALRGLVVRHGAPGIMTPESIGLVKTSHASVAAQPRRLAAQFYVELFTAAPGLRPLFPAD